MLFVLRFLVYSIKKKGELWISSLLFFFYFYYSYSLGSSWIESILLECPVLFLNYLCIRYLLGQIPQRLTREELRPLWEGITSFFLLFILLFFLVWQESYFFTAGLWLPFSLWLLLQLYLKRLGPFYAGFLGLLLLFLIGFSCFLLYWFHFALSTIKKAFLS